MRNATPIKVRRAIVQARKRGLSYAETAKLLSIGEATVSRVLRLHRETKRLDPRPIRGGNYSPIVGKVAELLVAIVESMPDATIAELTDALVRRSRVETSVPSVQRALRRLGFSRKKSPLWQQSGTPRPLDDTGESSVPGFSR
jgi:transposase